jgi:hypothetical protein
MKRKMKMQKRAYKIQREDAIKQGLENIPLPWDEWMKLKENWKEKDMRKDHNRRKRGIIEPRPVYVG